MKALSMVEQWVVKKAAVWVVQLAQRMVGELVGYSGD